MKKECAFKDVEIRLLLNSADIRGWLPAVADLPYPALLESSRYDGQQGHYSILAWEPYKKITCRSHQVEMENLLKNTSYVKVGNPFSILSSEFNKHRISPDFRLPFAGGAIGYFSYDLRHQIESLPQLCNYQLPVADFTLCFYDKAIIFDHKKGATYWVGKNSNGIKKILRKREICLKKPQEISHPVRGCSDCKLYSNFSARAYKSAIQKIIDYIGAGDIFQANLSQRFEGDCNEDGLRIYQRLRSINPAPFSAFLRYPEFEIISSSPERFLLLDGDKVTTRPIKGTRKRIAGHDAFNDKMKKELLNSKKDHAELAMIVDLERNDLGRVCSYGSIKVREHAVLETYPTVFHLVSTIEGELHRPRFDEFDLIRAAFPGGSITGAPKIRAMEIIEELEPVARNVYTGSIGYISFHGRMDMNILIRTMLKFDNRIYMQFGGGIVADSDPDSEYEETINKGDALFKAVGAENYSEIMATVNT